jgi:RsiW-degrading membrane proteinase PrsW (M82 family)
MRCQQCDRESADAVFCTWCGARQGSEGSPAGRGTMRFAAHPNEEVLQPAVISTLMPHLGHRQVNEFRWALVSGSALIALLYLAGLITAAILMGAIFVPVVYLLYLYEVRVYRDAPIPVTGLTMGAGVVLGVIVTLIIDALAGSAPLLRSTPLGLTVDVLGVVLFLIVVPILVEIVKPLPALVLRRSGDFPETIDGLVFGVAAGLGFAASETIVHFSQVIITSPIRIEPGNWIYPLASIAILMPLLQGTATGLIAGAVWQIGKRPFSRLGVAAIGAAVIGHIAFVLGSALAAVMGFEPIVVVLWQAVVVGTMLIAVRTLLHRALLDEAAALGLAALACPNCDAVVTAAGFCPACGLALAATPRAAGSGRHDVGRTGRPEDA